MKKWVRQRCWLRSRSFQYSHSDRREFVLAAKGNSDKQLLRLQNSGLMLPARSLVRTAQNFRHSAYPSKGAQISLHRASYHSPSRSLGARLWFRKDGTPRSKARGLVIGSFISAKCQVSRSRITYLSFYSVNFFRAIIRDIRNVSYHPRARP